MAQGSRQHFAEGFWDKLSACVIGAGADPLRRSAAGLTAADCAKRFDSPQHVESLLILEEAEAVATTTTTAAGIIGADDTAATTLDSRFLSKRVASE